MEKVKTFCLHHTGAPERKEKLLPVFDALKIDVEWVESFHPSEIDRSTLDIQKDDLNMGVISLYLNSKKFLSLVGSSRFRVAKRAGISSGW